jgi:hypothetical protein
VRFTAKDGKGGHCRGSVKVCVPTKPGRRCVDDGPLVRSTGPCKTKERD